jgi:dihydrofolate reductase
MISLIVAMDRSGLIGKNGEIPWRIKSELQHFKNVTTGGVCVFGRKTWESLPKKPLPDRVNIVISKSYFSEDNKTNILCSTISNIHNAINICHNSFPNKEIFICGGASLYEQVLTFADRVYLSCIWGDYEGDTFFPCKPFDLMYEKGFTITNEFGTRAEGNGVAWDFYLLERHVRTF